MDMHGATIGLEQLESEYGLKFRRFRGKEDLAPMAEVINSSREADGVEFTVTVEDLAAQFENPLDFDPVRDVLVVEFKGEIVGLSRIYCENRADGRIMFGHSVELVPSWRGKGIREALFAYNEQHIKDEVAVDAPRGKRYYLLWTNDSENEWKTIVSKNGYEAVQHEMDLVRSLDEIPDIPLPPGFEILPVKSEHYQEIWKASGEAWRQDWNYCEDRFDDAHFEEFKRSHVFQPELWQVAWHGDELAGTVLNYVVDEENEQFSRRRGHTEHVFVREKYRGRGLARALLARSFRVLKDRGMNEAMLGMEVENPHDPMKLYQGMGFRVEKHFTWYQKPF